MVAVALHPDTLACVEIDASTTVLVLPRSLWTRVRIGDRLVVTTNGDDVFAPVPVECDDAERPFLRLPAAPAPYSRRAYVRWPRLTPHKD